MMESVGTFESKREVAFIRISELAQIENIGSDEQDSLLQLSISVLRELRSLDELQPYLLILKRKAHFNERFTWRLLY